MSNFHNDEWVMNKIQNHYDEALQYFSESKIIGIFCQGSTNYGLDTENSDIDTKLVVAPSFEDIALNKQPISTTHIRENDEHIDFKDFRLMLQTFKKQNINFLEILFTPYKILNPLYEAEWKKLEDRREEIAHYNEYQFFKATEGVMKQKYFAMEHRYPSKASLIDEYGYDGKQLHHLVRLQYFLEDYFDKKQDFAVCLQAPNVDYLKKLKENAYWLADAQDIAIKTMNKLKERSDYIKDNIDLFSISNASIDELLEQTQVNLLKIALQEELKDYVD